MPNLTKKANLAKHKPASYDLLSFLSTLPYGSFMELFAKTGKASEKELLVYQTIRAMVLNYNKSGDFTSLVDVKDEDYFIAFDWLVESNYLSVDGDRCQVTNRLIGKLFDHFHLQIAAHEKAISGQLSEVKALSPE